MTQALVEQLKDRIEALNAEIARLEAALNTPQLEPFAQAVVAEAQHQVARWGADHDAAKTPLDWFWTLGHLGKKAAMAQIQGDLDKALHHAISSAALLAHWHRHLLRQRDRRQSGMRGTEITRMIFDEAEDGVEDYSL